MIREVIKGCYRFFSRFKKKADESDDLIEIVGRAGHIIDKLVMDLLANYYKQLLLEPPTYIIPAVWGATKDGSLDATQRQMHALVLPVVEQIQSLLDLHDLRASQSFAIGFLIRGYIISRVTHMVEVFKGRVNSPAKADEYPYEYMMNVKPLGTA
jgi:hypothetical protein